MGEQLAGIAFPEDLAAGLPSDEPLGDWIEGEGKPEPTANVYSSVIAIVLVSEMFAYLKRVDLGRAVAEVLFRLQPGSGRMRRPDVTFVSYDRWAKDRDLTSGNEWEVVPELAVEVVSPTDEAEGLMEKVYEYLAAGVVEVWVIYPALRRIHRFGPGGAMASISPSGTLDGGSVLPGFALPLDELFRNKG